MLSSKHEGEAHERRTLIYISGPSCSGKTTLSDGLNHYMQHSFQVFGDTHWIQYPGEVFDQRVRLTSRAILEQLQNYQDRNCIILEWVPSSGLFVYELDRICRDQERRLLRIVLHADTAILKARKYERDQDGDTQKQDVGLVESKNCCLIDTGEHDTAETVHLARTWLAEHESM
jgi:uridine kinase